MASQEQMRMIDKKLRKANISAIYRESEYLWTGKYDEYPKDKNNTRDTMIKFFNTLPLATRIMRVDLRILIAMAKLKK